MSNNRVFLDLEEVIKAAEEAEDNLWDDVSKALRNSKSSMIFTSLKDFITTAAFVDVGDSIDAYFSGVRRQYEMRDEKGEGEAFLDRMFLSFQDSIRNTLNKHGVQEKIINSFLGREDLYKNFKSGFTGKFSNGTDIKGGGQSIINEIKEEAQRIAWTSQFPGFDFKIEPYGSGGKSTDMAITVYYIGPRGGKNSFTFFEDVKSRLDGLVMGSLSDDYSEDLYKVLTAQAKYKYTDGTFVVTIKGAAIEKLVANAIASKIGRQNNRLSRRVVYTDATGGVKLLSELLSSPDFEMKIGEYYNKANIHKIGINIVSGYGRRKK